MRYPIRVWATLSLALVAGACSGNSLVDSQEGTLQIEAVHHRQDGSALAADDMGRKTFVNDEGYTIELTEAVMNWRSLKLISGGTNAECVAGNDREIDINQVEDWLAPDLQVLSLATASIPEGAYCQYELTLAPTLADAAVKFHAGEEHGDGPQGIGVTFHLAGNWAKDNQTGSFEWVSTDAVKIAGHFQVEENGQKVDHPLHFHEGEDQSEVMFGSAYDKLFDGLDFVQQDEAARQEILLENFQQAVHQHMGAPHGS